MTAPHRGVIAGTIVAGLAVGVALALWLPRRPAETEAQPPPPESFARVFEPCAHCHQIGAGARSTAGPPLQDIVGRRAGSFAGYPYSQAMHESALTWTPDVLDRFIATPQVVVPGTRMMFAGIPDPEARAALVAFLVAPKPD